MVGGVLSLGRDDPRYLPALCHYLGTDAPKQIGVRGDLAVLQRRTVALFCSVRCPGALILRAFELARALREAGVTVVGGFHAPLERECLEVLLRGTQPIVICPARAIDGMRLPAPWRVPLQQGRLLLLSPFAPNQRRATAELAGARNLFAAVLADAIVVVHAAPGGRMERLAATALAWDKPLYTLPGDENAALIALGARPMPVEEIVRGL